MPGCNVDKDIIQAKTMRTFQAARINPHQDVSRKLPSGSRLHMRYGQGELTLALQRVDTYPKKRNGKRLPPPCPWTVRSLFAKRRTKRAISSTPGMSLSSSNLR